MFTVPKSAEHHGVSIENLNHKKLRCPSKVSSVLTNSWSKEPISTFSQLIDTRCLHTNSWSLCCVEYPQLAYPCKVSVPVISLSLWWVWNAYLQSADHYDESGILTCNQLITMMSLECLPAISNHHNQLITMMSLKYLSAINWSLWWVWNAYQQSADHYNESGMPTCNQLITMMSLECLQSADHYDESGMLTCNQLITIMSLEYLPAISWSPRGEGKLSHNKVLDLV